MGTAGARRGITLRATAAAIAFLVVGAGCGHSTRPGTSAPTRPPGSLAEPAFPKAGAADRTDAAIGSLVDAAERAWRTIEQELAYRSPTEPAPGNAVLDRALVTYDHAVSRILATIDKRGAPLRVSGPTRSYEVTWSEAARERWPSDRYRLIPADEFEAVGFEHRFRVRGVGTPVVAIRVGGHRLAAAGSVVDASHQAGTLTAVLRFQSAAGATVPAHLELYDALSTESMRLGDIEAPLAGDFTAALSAGIGANRPAITGELGMVRPNRKHAARGLYLLEDYRTGAIPLVLIHGLAATANTFTSLVNELRGDPDLRHGYQIWAFEYPTGLPLEVSALNLRTSLRAAIDALDPDGRDAALRNMVLLGHSMGGLIARMQVTEPGTALWDLWFTRPPGELGVAREDSELLQALLRYDADPHVSRVVFLAVPHRGCPLAGRSLGRIGAAFTRSPPRLRRLLREIRDRDPELLAPTMRRRVAPLDGIEAIAPDSEILRALLDLPMEATVSYDTVVGIRDASDPTDSSDGVVPFWSSHLDGASSEWAVPGNHIVHAHPAGIAAIKQVLRDHLDASARSR